MKKTSNFIRDLELDSVEAMPEDSNVISFSCASELPYVRTDKKGNQFAEDLLINEDSVDFTRLVDGRAPLLESHDTDKQIGVIEHAWIADKKLYVTARFSRSDHAQSILNDMKDGIRRNVSIGYSVMDYTFEQSNTGGIPTKYVNKFMVYEISQVSCPADYEVGVGRSLETEEDEDMNKDENQEEQVEQTEQTEQEEQRSEEVQETQENVDTHVDTVENTESPYTDAEEIRSLGELMNMNELAEEFITNKRSYSEFKETVKSNKEKTTLNVKEKNTMEKFSLRKAILNAVGKMSDEEAAFERGIIEENKRKFNITDADIVLSQNEIRAFDGTEALVATQYQPGMYTPNLRPAVTVNAVGTKKVTVTNGPISFAVCTSGLNAGFVALNGEVPSANMNFELKTMAGKKQGAFVDVQYASLLQDDPSAEGIIFDDITKALDQSKDIAFFNGLSGNNEPIGLLNTTGVNTVTIPSGGATLSTVLEFEKEIRDSFDYSGNLKWVMSPDMYYKWAATPYSAKEQNRFLVDPDTRKCLGYDVYMDAAVPSGTVILGNFDEALEAQWDGMTIRIVEDAALARKQAVEIVAHRTVDFCIRRPKSFSIGTTED